MLSNLSTTDCFVIFSIILSLVLIVMIFMFITMKNMKNRMNDMSSMMYALIKKNDIQTESSDEIKQALSVLNNNLKNVSVEINGNIGSLSSSTSKTLKEIKANTSMYVEDGYYPTPNISKMMRETIIECINIETLLNKNLRIPNPNSTHHIIETVAKTYPNVNKEYVTKLSMAMIENFIEDLGAPDKK